MVILSIGASLIVQQVKNLPAIQETQGTWVRSLGWEDPLEDGNPLQYSAWQAIVHGVTKSWT